VWWPLGSSNPGQVWSLGIEKNALFLSTVIFVRPSG